MWLFCLPNKRRMNWVQVCLLTPQPVVMKAEILSVQRLCWGYCLYDCVCCQMLHCNWKATVWALLPSPGTSGMLALSGALQTHLFIHSAMFVPSVSPYIRSSWQYFVNSTLKVQFARCFNVLAKQLKIFWFLCPIKPYYSTMHTLYYLS